jgi:radical SAM superfamily enzyme YgiQ (UPF0313 family)
MVAEYPDLLDLAREAHLDKFFIGFESINPNNRRELGGKTRGEIEQSRRVIKRVHEHGIGVVGLFVFGFDSDTLETFDAAYDFIRSAELDGVSATVLTPFPGTAQRASLLAAGRILPHDTWEHYDTNHVTYVPAKMTVEELTAAYDRLCRRIYHPARIFERGFSALQRHPVHKVGARFFSSFSTDIGYRREYSHRNR